MEFADSIIQQRLEVFSTALDQGASPSELRIYSGSKPALKGGAIDTQVLLVRLVFPRPAKASLVGNTLTLNDPPVSMVLMTGIATWARFVNGDGDFLADAVVSQPADATEDPPTNGIPHGTGDVWLDKTQLYQGGEVTVTLGTFSEA